ncbi:GMC family oxidoreductase [soil metagenome]
MDLVGSLLTKSVEALAAASMATPFDAVVVGGGSAGISAARRLVEGGKRVAMLEAGPLALLSHIQSTDLRFDREVVRSMQRGLQYSPKAADGSDFGSLISCLGGRGLFWNGAAPRFAEEDFHGWPIDYAALDPHYAWAEREYRVTSRYGDGPLAQSICRLMRRGGIDTVPGPYAVDDHPTRDGWLAGTVGNAIAPLLRSGLLTASAGLLSLACRAFARRVLLDGTRAAGLEVVDLDTGVVHMLHARSVVLAAGGFESARLAMVSALPDPHGLMGRSISDHLFCRAYFPMPPETYDPANPEIAILWSPARDGRHYQIEVHLPNDNMFLARDGMRWAPDRSPDYSAMVRSFGPVEPRPENHIVPTDGDKPGCFTVHMSLDDHDEALRQQMVDAISRVGVAIGGDAAPVQTMPLGASHHEAGGLAMGTDAGTSVVDRFGRFWATKGLVVADAAAWPAVSPANPHLTIVALARRAGEQLLTDLEE